MFGCRHCSKKVIEKLKNAPLISHPFLVVTRTCSCHNTQKSVITVQVSYDEYPGYPGARFFRCEPLWAKLTPEACSKNVATKAAIQCARCPIGKLHVLECAPQLPKKRDRNGHPYRGVEPARRCTRCSNVTFRLLGGMICVSCYNRQRELRIGANAKGGPPRLAATQLHRAVCLVDFKGDVLLLELDYCSGRDEAERIIELRWPGALLVDYEVQPAMVGTQCR